MRPLLVTNISLVQCMVWTGLACMQYPRDLRSYVLGSELVVKYLEIVVHNTRCWRPQVCAGLCSCCLISSPVVPCLLAVEISADVASFQNYIHMVTERVHMLIHHCSLPWKQPCELCPSTPDCSHMTRWLWRCFSPEQLSFFCRSYDGVLLLGTNYPQ